MTYNAPNYFEQGSQKLVLNGDVEYGSGYNPSGDGPLVVTPGDNVPALGGSLTGDVTGDMADVDDIAISTSGGDTYSDAAVNAAVNAAVAQVNLQFKELQTKFNALIDSLEGNSVLDDGA